MLSDLQYTIHNKLSKDKSKMFFNLREMPKKIEGVEELKEKEGKKDRRLHKRTKSRRQET